MIAYKAVALGTGSESNRNGCVRGRYTISGWRGVAGAVLTTLAIDPLMTSLSTGFGVNARRTRLSGAPPSWFDALSGRSGSFGRSGGRNVVPDGDSMSQQKRGHMGKHKPAIDRPFLSP